LPPRHLLNTYSSAGRLNIQLQSASKNKIKRERERDGDQFGHQMRLHVEQSRFVAGLPEKLKPSLSRGLFFVHEAIRFASLRARIDCKLSGEMQHYGTLKPEQSFATKTILSLSRVSGTILVVIG